MLLFFYVLKILCLFFTILITFNSQNTVYSVLHLVIIFVTGSILLLLLGVDFLPYIFIIVYAGAVAVLFLFVVIILKIKLKSTKINLYSIFTIFFISAFVNSWTVPISFLNLNRYDGKYYDVPSTVPKFCAETLNAWVYFPLGYRISSLNKNLQPGDNGDKKIWFEINHIIIGRSEPFQVRLPENTIICTRDAKTDSLFYFPYPKGDPNHGVVIDTDFYIYDYPSNIVNLGKILYTEYNIHFVIAGLILLVAIVGAISLTRRQSTSRKQKVYKQISRSDIVGKISS